MKDPRIEKLAKLLINYSVSLKKGEKILIEAFDVDYMLVAELVKEVYRVGGYPFVEMVNNRVQREILMGAGEEECKLRAKYAAYRMNDMDAYIGLRGGENTSELSDIPAEARRMDAQYYSHPVHHEIRVKKTKWVVLRYPNPSMAQLADMSTEAFENFYFDVCTLDYSKMNRAMDALSALMNRTDKVRLVAPGTDLTFSIKGIGSTKCAGNMNIPDGEVYSAPVRDSVNGVITYNAPSITAASSTKTSALRSKTERSWRRRAIIRIRSTRFSIRTRARATSGNSPSASTPISRSRWGIYSSTRRSPAPFISRRARATTTVITATFPPSTGIWFSS